MLLTLSTYGGSPRVLKMQLFGGWSPENAIFSASCTCVYSYIYRFQLITCVSLHNSDYRAIMKNYLEQGRENRKYYLGGIFCNVF